MGSFRSYPRHLKPAKGKGYTQCERTGFLRHPDDIIEEWNGARVAIEEADITPGFGTRHPQDVWNADAGGDPTPTEITAGVDVHPQSKQDLKISDKEIRAAIVENRPPRPGY